MIDPEFKKQIKKAVEILKAGGVVVFPTETAYGLAADATNIKAIRRVSEIKDRTPVKTFPLIAADQKMVEKYAILSPLIKSLTKKHWPGALTVVVPARPGRLKEFALIRSGTLAVRVSSHFVAKELSRRLDRPIISTSANLSGWPTCYSVRAVKKQLVGKKNQPDFYLDIGRLLKQKLSTIVEEKNGEVVVLRSGGIKI
ncbi:MAG: L-threonylcarbamoyladenylate synthase [Candidatus Uhrbacteria bacterium]